MAITNLTGPKINPYEMISKVAQGALAENSFVKVGTAADQVIPVAGTGNENAYGFVDRAVADAVYCNVLQSGNKVHVLADGAITKGMILVTGKSPLYVKDGTAQAVRNQVGIADSTAADEETVEVTLKFISERT